MDAPSESVLDRNHGTLGLPVGNRVKGIFEGQAGKRLDAHAKDLVPGMLTESSRFTLESDLSPDRDLQHLASHVFGFRMQDEGCIPASRIL
jgi:hypothetical protein